MPNTLVVSHSKNSENQKKKRGRPKKSHLPAKDKMAEPPEKKLKSSDTKKAHKSPNEVDMNISAATLAVELGFEKPHEKIIIKSSGNDKDEEMTKQVSPVEIIQQLIDYQKSCKCNCLAAISMQDIASHRIEITLLDRHSRDFFIMGLLRCGAVAFKNTNHHNSHTRNRYSYRLLNTRICQCCFLAVNNIGGKYLKNLKKHLTEQGVTSRLHGNHGRKPHHAISSSDITDVVEFVNRYASDHGVPAARRPKNPRAGHIIRLPPSDNVTSIHKKYKEFYEHRGKRAVALTSFRKIWSLHLPHIKLTFKDITTITTVKNVPPSISMQEPEPNVDNNTQHSSLQQVSQIQVDTPDTNTMTQSIQLQTALSQTQSIQLQTALSQTQSIQLQTALSQTQSIQLQTALSQKSPVKLPYEYSTARLPHNRMEPLSMYIPDGGNHDTLQCSYLFSQTSVPLNHRTQTVTVNSPAPTNDHTNMKTDGSQENTSPSANQHPSFPSTVSSPVRPVVPTDTFNPTSDKHVILFTPNHPLDVNSGHLHMAQLSQKNATAAYNPSLITNDIHEESPSLVGSGLTTLTQHIQMSLFQ